MKWKSITNSGAEVGFVVVKNVNTAALTTGQVVCWDTTTSGNYGLDVSDPAGASAGLICGTAHTNTAAGGKGLAQVYGYDSDALMIRNGVTASNDTLDLGDILDIVSASSCLGATKAAGAGLANTFAGTSNVAATVCPPMFVLMETFASYATSNVTTNAKVFLRCL